MITRYVARVLERAQYRVLEDGTFAATVRGLRGVISTGATLEACRGDLTEVVEECVLVRVARGLLAYRPSWCTLDPNGRRVRL